MDRLRLRPTATELLAGDPQLADMGRYIKHLISASDPATAAENAALVYLATMTAFTEGGLLHLEYVPRLLIDIRGQEFEVCLR
jgi:hypothetical protein